MALHHTSPAEFGSITYELLSQTSFLTFRLMCFRLILLRGIIISFIPRLEHKSEF